MDANDIQIFLCKLVKISGRSCLCCVKKYPFHSFIMLLLFLLYMFLPSVFILLLYSFPVVGFAFFVHRVFIGIERPKVRSVGSKRKRWKELKSRRSFRSLNRLRVPNQYNESSSMHDPPVTRQNVKETVNGFYTNTCAENKDVVFSTIFNDDLVDKNALVEENEKEIREVTVKSVHGRAGSSSFDASQPLLPVNSYRSDLVDKSALVEENLKEIREVTVESVHGRAEFSSSNASQCLMPVNHYRSDDGCQKDGFHNGNSKGETRESLDACEDEEERHEHRNKVVRRIEDDEKSLMDLGISEVERTRRLESLIARRRSRKLSSFQGRRNGMGAGVGNNSCGQISSLHIPKMNPFLAYSLGDPTSPVPGSAPSYLVPRSPFDLPYDLHEEKPILTGDSFHEEFMATHQKEPMFCRHESFSLANFVPPESTHNKHKTSFDSDFATKQLTSGRLGTSTVANKEDDEKQPEQDSSISNDANDNNHAREGSESSEKVVDLVHIPNEEAGTEACKKEGEVHHDASSDQSCSSSSSSEDEPILRPNREAILHSLSMSRMRVVSDREENNFPRHESFDCGPSTLFDKTKADCFFFGANKRVHHTSTNSIASDLQVEVSELGSPPLTNISSLDEEVSIHDEDMVKDKESLVNSTNLSEMDVNEARMRDVDEVSEHGTIEAEFSRRDHYLGPHESIMKPEKTDERDSHDFTEQDRQLTKDHEDSYGKAEEPSTFEKLNSQLKTNNHVNDPEKCKNKDLDNFDVDNWQGNVQNLSVLEPHGEKDATRGIKEEASKVAQDEDAFQKLGSTVNNHDFEKLDQDREGEQHALKIELQVSAPTSSSSSPKLILPSEVLIGQSSTSALEMDSEILDQDREGKLGVLEVETESFIHPSPSLEQVNTARVPVSAPASISSSPKFLLKREVFGDPSSTSTGEMDNEVPNQDREDHVLEIETKNLVHPPPPVGQADKINIQVLAQSSSSSSPKFVSQAEVLIGQSSSSNRETDNKAQVSNTEMEQFSQSNNHSAPDRLTEVAAEAALISSTSPISVLQQEPLTDHASSSSNFTHEEVNEVQQSDNRTSAVDSSNRLLPDCLRPTENEPPLDRSTQVTGVTPMFNDSHSRMDDRTSGTISSDTENTPNV